MMSEPCLEVGTRRIMPCRRFLEDLSNGAIFWFVYIGGEYWVQMEYPDRSQVCFSTPVGFIFDSYEDLVMDGLGFTLCHLGLYLCGSPPSHYRLVSKIDKSVLDTCGNSIGSVVDWLNTSMR
jgi:hypothetical protein